MKSLFLRMFLWFCGGTGLVVFGVVIGLPALQSRINSHSAGRSGRGRDPLAPVRVAADAYERGGRPKLASYLESLAQDTGVRGTLFDSSQAGLLSGRVMGSELPDDSAPAAENGLLLRVAQTASPGFGFVAAGVVVPFCRELAASGKPRRALVTHCSCAGLF